jgi:hypothetical protein
MRLSRHLDLALLALLLPVFAVARLPLLGWLVGAALYVGQQTLSLYLERRAQATEDLRTRVGLLAGGVIGRGWLVALLLLTTYLAGARDAALAAAIVFLAAFTVHFLMTLLLPPAPRGTKPPESLERP